MIKTYFVNVETKEFCRLENPAKRGECPVFYHGETAVFNVAFIRGDRSPFDVTGCTFCLAVDDNVKHDDELAVLCENITVENNVITVNASYRTQKFADLVKGGEYRNVYCEIYRVIPGETERKSIAYCNHGVTLKPTVYMGEDIPPEVNPVEYVTRAEWAMNMQVIRDEFDDVKSEFEITNKKTENAVQIAKETSELVGDIDAVLESLNANLDDINGEVIQ